MTVPHKELSAELLGQAENLNFEEALEVMERLRVCLKIDESAAIT